jgi:N12 class adenine-specific DNA methylase
VTNAAPSFTTTDPIAREMLKRIEASPYTLAYLLGGPLPRPDGSAIPVEELYAWESAQEEFADAIDAILNARIQQNELALAEKGWGADTLHGDLTRKPFVGSVIHLEPGENAMGYMNGLTYQIVQNGKLEESLRDTLDRSSTEMANALHAMASEANTDAAERAAAALSGDPYPEDRDVPSLAIPEIVQEAPEAVPAADVPAAKAEVTNAASSFGTADPIAREMLKRIEASPYTLAYLLGDDRARDSDDPPYEEDTEWAAARVRFADEIDAILNARVRQNVDALGERGWMQPVLHGDLTRGNAVIHLEPLQALRAATGANPTLNADGDMQGLAYRVSIASDTEGLLTRTVPDVLRDSSALFASELHGIAEQMKKDFDLVVAEREKALFQELLNSAMKFAVNVGLALKKAPVTPNFRKTLMTLESDWRMENESIWTDYEHRMSPEDTMADVHERFALSDDGRDATDIQRSAQAVLRLAEYLIFPDQESLEKLGQQIDDAGYTETIVRESAANPAEHPVTLENLDGTIRRRLPGVRVWSLMQLQESLQRTLDEYIVTHIRDHAPLVAQQAKANTLDQFMMGNVLKATSDAILGAIEDQTLPQDMRYAARGILQGPEGMTDYRAKIARMVFDAERAGPAAMEGHLDIQVLEDRFGSDAAFGVKYVESGVDGGGQSLFPDGTSAVICTNYALQVQQAMPNHDVQIVGFENRDNPDCAVSRENWGDGHDFAIVDHRYLVDAWAKLVEGLRQRVVYDMLDDQDARIVAETYGDPLKWDSVTEENLQWDRRGTEQVMAHINEMARAAADLSGDPYPDEPETLLGLKEIATMGDTYRRAVQNIHQDGGWDAVQHNVALQDRQQDALDYLIHVRAQSVGGMLIDQGWERSGAGYQHPEVPGVRIVGNGTASRSGGNLVQWGYRILTVEQGVERRAGTNIPDDFREEAETFARRLIRNAVEMAARVDNDLPDDRLVSADHIREAREALNQSIEAGMSLGDLAGELRAMGINAVMSSDDINRFFHMPVPADTMLLADASDRHEDTVPVIRLPGSMSIVAWKADLDAYLAWQAAEALQEADTETDFPPDDQDTMDPDLLAYLRERASILDGSHPNWSGLSDRVTNAREFVRQHAMRNPELDETWAAELRGNPFEYGEALGLESDNIRGIATLMEESVKRARRPVIGDLVRFEPHDQNPSKGSVFSGRVIAAQDTSGGDVRYHLRAETGPDQGMEGTVYGKSGSFRLIDLNQAYGFERNAPERAKVAAISPLPDPATGLHPAKGLAPATKLLSDPIIIDGKPMETREFLEERFGSDAAFGVRYVDESTGMDIPAEDLSSFEGDMISTFSDGGITNCTNYARYIQKALPLGAVQVVGFNNEENPDSDAVREGWHPGGHDFAIVDNRYLVDPWAKLVAGVRHRIAYDLQDDQDAALVAQTYGSPAIWSEIPEANRPRTYEWDRSGLEKVFDHRNARLVALRESPKDQRSGSAALQDAVGAAPQEEAQEESVELLEGNRVDVRSHADNRTEQRMEPQTPETPLEITDNGTDDRAVGAVDASTLLFLLQKDNGVSISDIVRHPDFKRQVFHGNGVVPYRVPEDFAAHAYVGEKTRARNNLAAVRLIKALDAAVSEKDSGTVRLSRELQDVLSRFAGWGGLPNMFRGSDDAFKEGWQDLGLALESLLTKQEMSAARRSTLDAHYTEISVVRAMWEGLRDAGLPDAQMVLEPSVGSGLFLGSAPEQVAQDSRFMACEMDAITAKIAQRLYPEARVQHAPYETFPIMRPDDTSADSMSADRDHGFDLVIGNPPFGDQRVYDADYPEISDSSPNIHTYFFEKSLRQLRPGGVMAMVVSRYLMDAKSPEYEDWRKRFALRADLKAAVRLPSNAFMKNAGTQVVTDILVFQRREVPLAGQVTDLANDQYPDWVFATDAMVLSEDGRDVSGNKYYAAYPEHLLGEPALARDMYGENRPVLLANRPTEMVAADICRAIGSADLAFNDAPSADMATGLSSSEEDAAWNNRATAVMDRHKDRSWFVVTAPDGEERLAVREIRTMSGYLWAKVRNDAQDAQVAEDASSDEKADDASADATAGFRPSEARRIIGMCHVRDALLDLMGKQVSLLSSTGEIDDAREHLNQVYDGFTKKYGLLRKKLNQRLFRSESSFGALLALEKNYVPAISATVAKKTGQPRREESAEKADVFFKRTQFPVEEPDRAADAMDALRLSLSQKGVVDRTYMAHLLRDDPLLNEKPAAERWPAIRAALGDAILLDPESGRFNVREMVLSGDVVTKLDLAHRYLESPSRFTGAEDVGDALEEWRRSVDGLESAQPERIGFYDIGFRLGTPWIPETVMRGFLDDQFGNLMSVSHVSSMGTWIVGGSADSDKDARWSTGAGRLTSVLLLKTVLNDQPAIIKVPDGDGGYRVDETQSEVLKARCEDLKEVWRSWLDEHESVRDAIEDAYNGLFNREVLPKYDGGHLSLAGASDVITLRPHQKNAIWRGLQGKNVLLDHAVGAGKTFAAVALAMEQRRLGLSQKPMLPVPNHLVGQWRDAFLTLYPGAQVLVAEKDDMSKQGRQAFLARAAYGDWDAIIVPHTTFGRIPPSPQDEVDYMETEISAFKEALSVYSNAGDKRSVKRMERKIATFESRMSKRVESLLKDDGALHMGNIGVDLLVVDEVQEFKNLPFTTNMKNVSGMGNPEGSLRATDLYIKIAGIQKRRPNGGGAVFLTGTPLSNTLAEMYIWQRYLDEKGLIRAGLLTFDAWKDTFSSVTREYGFTVTGEYKERTYLGKFENWPDLLRMLDRFKDSVTISDVREMLREAGMADMPIPKIAGGAPDIVKVEQTELQKEVIGFEVGENPDGTPKYNVGSIMYRLDHMPRRPGKGEDNILSLSGELTKVGLDVRALKRVDNGEGEENGSKLGAAANRILKFYHQWDEDKGTQLIFLDFSTPSNAGGKMSVSDQRVLDAMVLVREYEEKSSAGVDVSDDARAAHDEAMELLEKYSPSELESILDAGQSSGWSAYVELRGLLIEAGIPPHEIAFIHDYDGEKKDDLFGKVRSGVVRVLMGSSPKMGAGVNVQDRLVAAHHLDAPYRPLDLEQRNGRILRQGNKLLEKYGDDFAVGIHYYVTEGSGDPGRWQILEFKKRFIDQTRMPLNAVKGLRQLEDPASMALDPARVKAEASGSQVLMDRVEVADIVKKMEQTVRARVASMSEAKRAVERYAASVRWVEKGLSVLTQAAPLAAAFVEGLSVAESAAMDAERQRKDALKEARKEQRKLSKLDGNPVRTKADEDDEEASSSGFITVDAWNPLTGVVERMEHLTWKEVGILAEKSAVAMLQEASVSFSSKKIEISAHRAQDIVGRNLFTLRNVDGSEIGVVRVKSVKDRWYGGLVETGAFLSSPDAGYMEIIDDLKHFEFTPEDAFDVWADLESDRKSGMLDLSRLAASRSSSLTRTGKTIIGWPSRVGGKKDAYAMELVSVSAKLSAAQKEVERQSASTDQSSETVLRSAKETLAILESALKCGVRKYEAVDDRLDALSEALNKDQEQRKKARDAIAAVSGKETQDADVASPEKASPNVLEWKRDLLLSVREDLLRWGGRREESLEALRSGRLPAEDEVDDQVRYAGAEDQPPAHMEDGATTGSLPAGLPIRGAGPSDFPARP